MDYLAGNVQLVIAIFEFFLLNKYDLIKYTFKEIKSNYY